MAWRKFKDSFVIYFLNYLVAQETTFATFSTAHVEADVMLAGRPAVHDGKDGAVDRRDQVDEKAPEVHVQAGNKNRYFFADQRPEAGF
jgi:hypothetical protein